ncbi:MAG: HNH endonuclease [Candidatus Rokuibacteriota bacterium]
MSDLGDQDADSRVRLAAFEFLATKTRLHGGSLPWKVLSEGFEFDARRVPLVGPQGIFKPAVLREMPLSIATAPPVPGKAAPYDDQLGSDGLLRYRYRGTDPRHPDNVGLRLAMQRKAPLVYLHGVVKGFYVAEWPVFIVGDDSGSLTFTVAVGKEAPPLSGPASLADLAFDDEGERRYATRVAMVRLHQQSFRRRVLQAYRDRCAVCCLRHTELLEAAHILPDGHRSGRPEVPNGLALCSLHHSAFDCYLMGVTPDLKVDIRLDVLHEIDGPMLQHGLQGFHGAAVSVPAREGWRPKREFLAERYELFKKAS